MKRSSLSSILREKVEPLEYRYDDGRAEWSWTQVEPDQWAAVELDDRYTIFSRLGIGARSATVTMRLDWLGYTGNFDKQALTLHNALRWRGQHLFLTSIVDDRRAGRLDVKAALVETTVIDAKPKERTGRDELNRPTVETVGPFRFTGVITEIYRGNNPREVYYEETIRHALVTPKPIVLKAGDIVQVVAGRRYVVREVHDLDPYKNEYVIEAEADV